MHNITQECVQWTALSHSWFLCDYCIFFPPVRMVLTVGFSYITFIMLSIYPLVLHSLRFLSLKYIEFGQRLLLHLLKWSLDILPYIHLFLNLWDKAHLIMVDNIFAVCLYLLYVYQGIFPLSLCAFGSECSTLINSSSFMMPVCSYHMPTVIIMNLSSETRSYPPIKCFLLKSCFDCSLSSQQ